MNDTASHIAAERRASLKRLLSRGKKLLHDLDNMERAADYEDPASRQRLDEMLTVLGDRSWGSPEADKAAARAEEKADEDTKGFAIGQAERDGKGPLSRAHAWVVEADTWAVHNCADPLPITQQPRPPLRQRDGSWDQDPLNSWWSSGQANGWSKWREVVAAFRRPVEARFDELTSHLAFLEGDRPIANRDTKGGWPHLRNSGVIEPAALDRYLETIGKHGTTAEIGNSIGASKELLEAALRGWLIDIGLDLADIRSLDLPQLVKRLRQHWLTNPDIAREVGDASHGVGLMLNGVSTIITGATQVRNGVGSGHGTPQLPVGVTAAHALFMADMTYAVTAFVAAQHQRVRDAN